MNIPVRFPATATTVIDSASLSLLAQHGIIRGRNINTRTLALVYSRACDHAGAASPSLPDFQYAIATTDFPAVGTHGYGVRDR